MLSGGSVQKLTPSNSLVAQTGAFYFFFFFFLFFFVEGGKEKKKKTESPTKSVLAEPVLQSSRWPSRHVCAGMKGYGHQPSGLQPPC